MHIFYAFRKPAFALLWSGQVISAFGDQLFSVAFLWLTTKQLGESAGVIFGTASLCALIFGPCSGILADRLNRRNLLIGADLARGFLVILLPLLLWLHMFEIWFLIPIILIKELLATFFEPALTASLPMLTDNTKILYAINNLMDMAKRFARMLCPGIAGLLLLYLSFAYFFTFDTISFVISAFVFLALGPCFRAGSSWPPLTIGQKNRHMLGDLRKDLVLSSARAYQNRQFFRAVLSLGIMNIAWSIIYIIGLPLWTQRVLHASPAIFGLIASAYGAGNIVGIFLSTLRRSLSLRGMYIGKAFQGLGFILLTLAPSSSIAMGVTFVSALCGSWGEPSITLMIQTEFSQEHVGKIYSLRSSLGQLGLTLGTMAASLVYYIFNVTTGIIMSGLFLVAISILCLALQRSPTKSDHQMTKLYNSDKVPALRSPSTVKRT
ncbi:MFS transporter [Ktedonosporobacter rubrisoli]|uniref:MFS transporter n=1 Tax=Ktedonosporobacter rubrisoli TaxID=2509675 RepID=A0A4P6JPB6_KTERU|nr:MFS transporter [Ktedonosporobacter rubrisoli]QBD76922.1 MFS transporter [Ktedonosporobacter rubrisoli]